MPLPPVLGTANLPSEENVRGNGGLKPNRFLTEKVDGPHVESRNYTSTLFEPQT